MQTLLVDRADGVVTVALNRPEQRNAVNLSMVEELLAVLNEVEATRSDRVLVLTGAGDSFCAGADLADLPADCGAILRQISQLGRALHRLPKPTMTSLNGTAAGLGANLALATDLVLAGASASMMQLFAHRALCTDGNGGQILSRALDARKAEELAFVADPITADQGLKLGLFLNVVPDRDLIRASRDYAKRIANAGPKAVAKTEGLLGASVGAAADRSTGSRWGGTREALRGFHRAYRAGS